MTTNDSYPRAVRDLVIHFQPLINSIAAICHGDDRRRNEIEYLLPHLDNNGWNIQAATERIWQGERDEVVLTNGLDENSAALIRAILVAIAGYQPEDEAQIASVISEWRPIILTTAAAYYDQPQAREDIEGFLPQLDQNTQWQTLAHRIRLLLAGETKRERLLDGLDPIDTVVMSGILYAIEDPKNLQKLIEEERQNAHTDQEQA